MSSYDTSIIIFYKGESYLVQFKREYYRSFSHHFPNIKKVDGTAFGWATIMSLTTLNMALTKEISRVMFITPDRKIYSCYANLFKRFYEKYKTNVPHLPGEVAMPLEYFERLKADDEMEVKEIDLSLGEFK
jgi:hypothetical protein